LNELTYFGPLQGRRSGPAQGRAGTINCIDRKYRNRYPDTRRVENAPVEPSPQTAHFRIGRELRSALIGVLGRDNPQ